MGLPANLLRLGGPTPTPRTPPRAPTASRCSVQPPGHCRGLCGSRLRLPPQAPAAPPAARRGRASVSRAVCSLSPRRALLHHQPPTHESHLGGGGDGGGSCPVGGRGSAVAAARRGSRDAGGGWVRAWPRRPRGKLGTDRRVRGGGAGPPRGEGAPCLGRGERAGRGRRLPAATERGVPAARPGGDPGRATCRRPQPAAPVPVLCRRCPVTTASPVTGCSQVVLLASSLRARRAGPGVRGDRGAAAPVAPRAARPPARRLT